MRAREWSCKSGEGNGYRWLLAHIDYQDDNCLPWPFMRDTRVGRGRVGYKGKVFWAHRLMCELVHGSPPTPKHQAAHTCGKGHYGCVNPRHLAWKTNSENQLDRRKNGNMLRNRAGIRGNLSPEQVAQIYTMRKAGETQVAIGKAIGASLGCVQYWLKYRAARGNDQGKIRAFSRADIEATRAMIATGASIKSIAESLGRNYGSLRRLAKAIRGSV